jgi:hypothetical protein
VIANEFDDMPQLVPLMIEPMLADRVGALVRSGTPKGNGLLQLAYDRARVTAGYSAYLLDYTRTHALSGRVARSCFDHHWRHKRGAQVREYLSVSLGIVRHRAGPAT